MQDYIRAPGGCICLHRVPCKQTIVRSRQRYTMAINLESSSQVTEWLHAVCIWARRIAILDSSMSALRPKGSGIRAGLLRVRTYLYSIAFSTPRCVPTSPCRGRWRPAYRGRCMTARPGHDSDRWLARVLACFPHLTPRPLVIPRGHSFDAEFRSCGVKRLDRRLIHHPRIRPGRAEPWNQKQQSQRTGNLSKVRADAAWSRSPGELSESNHAQVISAQSTGTSAIDRPRGRHRQVARSTD